MSSSTGSINADVNITINADDKATIQVESSARKINRQWREMRLEQRAVQQSFELTNRRFVATSRVLNQVGSIVGRVQSAFNTYQLSQLRLQSATQNAADAQRSLSDAIVEFGLNSPEALEAARRNIQAAKDIERANQDAALSYIFIGTAIVTAFGGIPRLIGNIKNLNRTLKGAPTTTSASSAVTSKATGAATSKATGGVLGKILPKVGAGAAGFGIGALLGIASDIQPAFGGRNGEEAPGEGIDAIAPLANLIGEKAEPVINNIINVFANTAQEIVEQITSSVESVTRGTGQ